MDCGRQASAVSWAWRGHHGCRDMAAHTRTPTTTLWIVAGTDMPDTSLRTRLRSCAPDCLYRTLQIRRLNYHHGFSLLLARLTPARDISGLYTVRRRRGCYTTCRGGRAPASPPTFPLPVLRALPLPAAFHRTDMPLPYRRVTFIFRRFVGPPCTTRFGTAV